MSSQSISYSSDNGGLFCDCNLRPVLYTAYTAKNYGRRFLKCSNRVCKYFHWIDPPLEANHTNSIEKLQEKNKELEDIIKAKDKQLSMMWRLIFVLVAQIVFSRWFM